MVKKPFDVNKDLGVAPVDCNEVDLRKDGPQLYPSEGKPQHLLPLDAFQQAAEIEAATPAQAIGGAFVQAEPIKVGGTIDSEMELATAKAPMSDAELAAIRSMIRSQPAIGGLFPGLELTAPVLEEPVGPTPKFNPTTQQWELPE